MTWTHYLVLQHVLSTSFYVGPTCVVFIWLFSSAFFKVEGIEKILSVCQTKERLARILGQRMDLGVQWLPFIVVSISLQSE